MNFYKNPGIYMGGGGGGLFVFFVFVFVFCFLCFCFLFRLGHLENINTTKTWIANTSMYILRKNF